MEVAPLAITITEMELKGIKMAHINGDSTPLSAKPNPTVLYISEMAKLL
jgi:hypothetical protein